MKTIGNYEDGYKALSKRPTLLSFKLPTSTMDLLPNGNIRISYIGGESETTAEMFDLYEDMAELLESGKFELSKLVKYLSDSSILLWGYGQPIVGTWYCSEHHSYFPRQLKELKLVPPFTCPQCGGLLTYDEDGC
jgi:hypothetical protein